MVPEMKDSSQETSANSALKATREQGFAPTEVRKLRPRPRPLWSTEKPGVVGARHKPELLAIDTPSCKVSLSQGLTFIVTDVSVSILSRKLPPCDT
eukprot:2186655-Amphidinium_carterae.1